jgi:CRP-like cAMP-binding protein
MSRLRLHPERHLVTRIGWLRAAVLGANDGIVSTASLIVGVAAAAATQGEPEPILPKISQETLAEMIGTTRSRVSAFMNKFRLLGLINYNGRIEVHRSLLNVILHESPQIRG